MRFAILLLLALGSCRPLAGDEGMWPISEIRRLDLESKGLRIPVGDIYTPDKVSLIDGICGIGGCTGSFVSSEGLILTNHHCAFGAIQDASTPGRNYLENGFVAAARSEEVPARGYTVRITESYRDVSRDVLSAVQPSMDAAARARAVDKRRNELVLASEAANPGKRAEVAEMFIGKTYILFLYTHLKDVRLVLAPPRGIGDYGGETDNWVWPRHTGDFSFFRAYVSPDGAPADYAATNVPYRPRRLIQVEPKGVSDGDFIFIFGYPGRTYRNQAAAYLGYEYRVRLPMTVDWYGRQIECMNAAGKTDPDAALKLAPRIKSLANTWKNYRGKLAGIRRTGMMQKWEQQDARLEQFIRSDPSRQAKYGAVTGGIAEVYRDMEASAEREFLLQQLVRSPDALRVAYTLYEAARERRKPDVERESDYMERNWKQTADRLLRSLKNFHAQVDRTLLRDLMLRAAGLQSAQPIRGLERAGKGQRQIDKFLDEAYAKTAMTDEGVVRQMLTSTPVELQQSRDPFMSLAVSLYGENQARKDAEKRRTGELNRLYGLYVDAKRELLGAGFVPDANSTLRLTYGRIRGYQPADALVAKPITTLAGVVEKSTGEYPFAAPKALLDLHRSKDFGPFVHPALKDVPVAILYDADTTGGNSGSPVMNADGRLVGVNFDRAWEATINDYGWSPLYSRSIAVDIRYVLWVTLKIGRGEHLLREMGIR